MTRVLIIEDDEHLAKILSMELAFEQYEIEVRKDGLEGLETALTESFDLILVDLMLPSMNGFEIARRIRIANKQVGIIMMTAKDSLTDIVLGLDSGADDYLSKPFAIEELLARMRVLLRRNKDRVQTISPQIGSAYSSLPAVSSDGPIFLDEFTQTVTRNQKITKLSKREFNLLKFFVDNEGQLLDRETIFTSVWKKKPRSSSEVTIVDVYVRYIRKKLDSSIIRTIYGKGYIYGDTD